MAEFNQLPDISSISRGYDAVRNHKKYENDMRGVARYDANLLSYWRHEHLDALMETTIPDEFIPKLEDQPGRWHPSGFMVFPVSQHPFLGFIRLHVWPQGLRQRQDRGRGNLGVIYDGDIHNHAWNVSGLNIEGYRDILYVVNREGDGLSDEEIADRGLFRVFRAHYVPDGPDELRTTHHCVSVTIQEERELLPTDIHDVELHEYHAPTIPEDQFGATLAINSYRITDAGPDILIGGSADPIVAVRREITIDERLLAKEQLLKVL